MPVGKIDIMRNFSFFEVPSEFQTNILKGLNKRNWDGNSINVEISQAPEYKSDIRGVNGSRKRNRNKSQNTSARKNTSKRRYNRESAINKRSEAGKSSFKRRFNASTKRKKGL